MPALSERLELIVEGGDKLQIRWEPQLPEFTVIDSETEDSEESEEWWSDSELEPMDD